jgi:glycosyltransferase involved in cell wall biosynthesis
MNVMLVVPWDEVFGGVASVVGNLATCLERAGHRVVFVHPGPPDRRRRRTTTWGFTGYELNLRSPFIDTHPVLGVIAFLLFFPFTMYQLLAIARAHDVELVNVHYPIEAFVYFAVLRRLRPIRLVVSAHGADLFPDGGRPRRYPVALRALMAAADALVAPSRAFLADCLTAFPRAAAKGVAVHNGIDAEELQRVDETLATARWQPYLLTIAAHNRKKALDVLLHAFARVGAAHPGLRLLLAGDGPLRAQYETLARSLGIADRVEFLGWQGRPQVARLLRDCALFVLPSRSEPFGMVVAEAMACRKAVVASAVGGIGEIVESGRTGLLVEPDDPEALAGALRRVLEDEALRESLAHAGWRRVRERFGRDRMGAGYVALYAALREGRGPRAGDGRVTA